MTGSKNTGSTTRKSPAAKSKMSGLGVIGELDRYYYGEGRHYKIFEKLGAHPFTISGERRILLCRMGASCSISQCRRRF